MEIVWRCRNYARLVEGRVVAAGGKFYVSLHDMESGVDYPSMWPHADLDEAKSEAEFQAKFDV